MRALQAIIILAVLAALVYGVFRAAQWCIAWRVERTRARSKWAVETRAARSRRAWAVVLRRPGEEQVFKTVSMGNSQALLNAQAEAEEEAAALNEGRRKS